MQWPTGTGAKGNAGVAGAVQQTAGAVGYVEQAYALAAQLHLRVGEEQVGKLRRADAGLDERRRRRRDGAGEPRHQSHQLAEPERLPDHLADVHRRQQGPLQGRASPGGEAAAKGVVKFLDYGLGEGQTILSQADYAALPAAILAKSKEAAAGLQCNGSGDRLSR